jgi:hypothetical protein
MSAVGRGTVVLAQPLRDDKRAAGSRCERGQKAGCDDDEPHR